MAGGVDTMEAEWWWRYGGGGNQFYCPILPAVWKKNGGGGQPLFFFLGNGSDHRKISWRVEEREIPSPAAAAAFGN